MATDNSKICGVSQPCDEGKSCWKINPVTTKECKKCHCYTCIKGKCHPLYNKYRNKPI